MKYAYKEYVMEGELRLIKSYVALFLSPHFKYSLLLFLTLPYVFLLLETDLCTYQIHINSAGLISGLYNTLIPITLYKSTKDICIHKHLMTSVIGSRTTFVWFFYY